MHAGGPFVFGAPRAGSRGSADFPHKLVDRPEDDIRMELRDHVADAGNRLPACQRPPCENNLKKSCWSRPKNAIIGNGKMGLCRCLTKRLPVGPHSILLTGRRLNMALKSRQIYVNLHVKDVRRSIAFFTDLGFEFDPRFTDGEKAACLVIGENIYAMLLREDYLKSFTKKDVVDTGKYAELTVALAAESREQVDDIVNRAVSLGGRLYAEPQDHGFFYQWGFEDPDGHIWEIGYMDVAALKEMEERRQG